MLFKLCDDMHIFPDVHVVKQSAAFIMIIAQSTDCYALYDWSLVYNKEEERNRYMSVH